jgi:GT2 family glycosyltransferase
MFEMNDVAIDLVVVNYKTYDLLQQFVDSYLEYMPTNKSTLTIVDVESDTEKLRAVNAPGANIIPAKENIGYSAACNIGAATTSGKNIAFFNSDTRFINDYCVDYCVEYLNSHSKIAVVGPLQVDDEGICTHGGIFGTLDAPVHRGWQSRNLSNLRDNKQAVTVSGSAYFIKRSVWNELNNCSIYRDLHPEAKGAFLPTPHYFEETACSYHAQAHGYEVWYLGVVEMIHHWHKSSPVGGSADGLFETSKAIFVEFCETHGIPHD